MQVRRPTTGQLALAFAAALLVLFCESKTLPMNDLAVYLALGREMADAGGYADVDRLTHTVAGTVFLNGTWGAQALFHRVWSWSGFSGLQVLLAIAVGGTVVTVAWACRRAARGRDSGLGIGALLSAWLVVQNLGLRPQLFALPLFAVYACLALSARPTAATIGLSAVLTALWANLHGSFPLGPLLSALVMLGVLWETGPSSGGAREWIAHALASMRGRGEAFGHAATAVAATLASFANPYGPSILGYVATNSSMPASRGLSEWAPTSLDSSHGVRLAVACAVVLFAFLRSGRWFARRDLPAIAAFGLLALTGIRHVCWLGIVLPPALARVFPAAPADRPPRRWPAAVAAATLLFWIALLVKESPFVRLRGLHGDEAMKRQFESDTPVELTAWATANGVSGRLFNSMEWGGFLSWRLPAEAKTFADVRIWIFPDPVWSDYLAVTYAEYGWERILDRYRVDWAILDRGAHRRLIPYLEASPGWERVYADDVGLIFRRRTP